MPVRVPTQDEQLLLPTNAEAVEIDATNQPPDNTPTQIEPKKFCKLINNDRSFS